MHSALKVGRKVACTWRFEPMTLCFYHENSFIIQPGVKTPFFGVYKNAIVVVRTRRRKFESCHFILNNSGAQHNLRRATRTRRCSSTNKLSNMSNMIDQGAISTVIGGATSQGGYLPTVQVEPATITMNSPSATLRYASFGVRRPCAEKCQTSRAKGSLAE